MLGLGAGQARSGEVLSAILSCYDSPNQVGESFFMVVWGLGVKFLRVRARNSECRRVLGKDVTETTSADLA